MGAWHLAQLNVAYPVGPMDSPAMADFAAGLDPINALAEASPGFVWRLQDDSGAATHFDLPGAPPDLLLNLTVWEDPESLRAYAYGGEHLAYVRRRREWFTPMETPHLVLWWIPAGTLPTLAEAAERLERLTRDGPGPAAFTLRDPQPMPAAAGAGAGAAE